MKVEVTELTDTKATLTLRGVNHAFVNALRRTLVAEVPKMAIDEVTIYDNTSGMFDEMVAHRLGMVPVPTNLQSYVPPPEVEDTPEGEEGAEDAEAEEDYSNVLLYTLSKEGPCEVLSGDLTPADPDAKVPDPNIPITKLLEGQRLMLEASAVFGTARKHAKWTSVSGATYREIPHVDTSKMAPMTPEVRARVERALPEGALEIVDDKLRVLDDKKAFDFLKSAMRPFGLEGIVLSREPDSFEFTFETDGSFTAKDALKYSVNMLIDKLKQVEAEVPKLELEEEAAA